MAMIDHRFELRPLRSEDAPHLSRMLSSQPPDYARHFHPFDFDEISISDILSRARRDIFMGMYWGGRLAGFFMLRGWDAGYGVPAYGVLIDRAFSRSGLGKLSLDAALTICRLAAAPRLMLKVHPDNLVAKRLYEGAGFVATGIDDANHNLIYHFDF